MRISVILAHPSPESLNHAIARAAVSELGRQGHEVAFHDSSSPSAKPTEPASWSGASRRTIRRPGLFQSRSLSR